MSLIPEIESGPDLIPQTALVLRKLEVLDAQRKTLRNLLKVCQDRDLANGISPAPVPALEPADVTDPTVPPAE